jgi:hypothetical protein
VDLLLAFKGERRQVASIHEGGENHTVMEVVVPRKKKYREVSPREKLGWARRRLLWSWAR